MAWLSTPALIGPVVGPPLGGLIVTYASWPWIFDINVPIGVLGIVLVSLYVKDVREPRPDRFDGVGLLLSGLCLSALMAGLETIGRGLLPHGRLRRCWRSGSCRARCTGGTPCAIRIRCSI